MDFRLVQNVKIVFGAGSLAQLGELVVSVGGKRPLVITDKGIVAAGIADKTNAALKNCGVEGVLFDGVEPDPSRRVVEAAWDLSLIHI